MAGHAPLAIATIDRTYTRLSSQLMAVSRVTRATATLKVLRLRVRHNNAEVDDVAKR
jgi:hypothetical protein